MVFRASNRKDTNAMIASDGCEVIPKARLEFGWNRLGPLFGAEDNVEEGTDVAMGHRSPS